MRDDDTNDSGAHQTKELRAGHSLPIKPYPSEPELPRFAEDLLTTLEKLWVCGTRCVHQEG
eukprot:scaffold26596_cov127-Cylindrotheca_fusiformis.AAC.2